ncbi:hybrid sensor histidine kinase/response regulator [Roseofilum casamattae]|uniref:histidine kinase n=1 Tax=Roseofilum casamattae BLCC-M143 TaxID=3022442 RepID=A0ABT7BYM9_9CYAN|nr:response regulator [Roseofilum casamattae]MDJ1183892.1 response regulator [Roseofilum casamattae BLCC-M143]
MTAQTSASILVVDDNPTNLKILLDLLTSSEYRVTIAKNGENALLRAQRTLPNLILLDVLMPGIDGFETCRRLKANKVTQNIPVVFMTALSDTVNKVKGLQLGAVDYITKPFDGDEVLARIQVHIELQKAQLQLIQEAGLATLGELVADIAHEINNPVNFISGNLIHAAQYHDDLLALLRLYERHYPNPHTEIEMWRDEIDLTFMKADTNRLFESMKNGADRIKGIVISLRSFAKLDESESKLANLQEGLKNTLRLLEYRLHAKDHRQAIQVIENYDSLPLIQCYPAQLNQVFMNLFVNAIDAIDAKCWHDLSQYRDEKPIPKLRISTTLEETIANQYIRISIADNGVGMSDSIQRRMFEQFFTTKSTGKGTGLGLSIARHIIEEQHKGAIACQSELGKGTEFILSLPLNLQP